MHAIMMPNYIKANQLSAIIAEMKNDKNCNCFNVSDEYLIIWNQFTFFYTENGQIYFDKICEKKISRTIDMDLVTVRLGQVKKLGQKLLAFHESCNQTGKIYRGHDSLKINYKVYILIQLRAPHY